MEIPEEINTQMQEICRAYMGAGAEIFENDDPKYFNFLKSKIKPPADGKW